MMNIFSSAAAFILAYLLGSIPTAVWTGRWLHNIDVREHGSGNAGATNVIRVLGWKTGLPVLMIDLAKGWLATIIPIILNSAESGTGALTNLQILAGLIAITGHILPVFAGFRGGKGVATMFGVLLALQPLLTVSCMSVFLVVLLLTGIVSISSMTAGIAFPLMLLLFFDTPSLVFKIFSVIVAIALILTHRKNIGRLIRGEEKKLNIFGKKDKPTV
ncbi:MAG: acyl-phosphate glycerol 3-phosphate acyltransferase [Bacteroidetes bacterium GWF2_41_9]|nr:MAG: acyl-phosphate glycerol 3-phosphate acyltransferase [Bacteroidetes bacterium GWC2_40_22]OFY59795.1 MAG: acyl-phosphate glycerol 3-phosphate acyltransferase [Bacteroidetes bacterium GWF2_41_9]